MRGTDTPILSQLLNAAGNWRNAADGEGVSLVQINAIFPDGKAVVLSWDAEAIDNGDGTFVGDWIVDT